MRKLVIGKNKSLSMNENFGGVNYLVLGAPGSGKTRYFLEPAILQMDQCSHIIIDIKGSLYRRLGSKLKAKGYHISCFDFINLDKEKYNPIEFVNNEEDALALAKVVNGKGSSQDPYWDNSAIDLLTSLIGYAADFVEYKDEYIEAAIKTHNSEALRFYQTREGKLSLSDALLLLPKLLIREEELAGHYTCRLNDLFEYINKVHPNWWPYRRFQEYVQMPPKTLACIINTIMSNTNAVRTNGMAKMMAGNEFDPAGLGQSREAIFISLKDYDDSLHQMAALMISQAINTLIQEAGDDRLDVPVQVWMDDCGSYVVPQMVQYLSCCRSRDIGFTMLCQSEHQLSVGYGSEMAETIVQCANTYIYMGGEDYTSSRRIAVRGNLMQSEVLSLDGRYMFVITQGQRLERVCKFDEESKRRIENKCVYQGTRDYNA